MQIPVSQENCMTTPLKIKDVHRWAEHHCEPNIKNNDPRGIKEGTIKY